MRKLYIYSTKTYYEVRLNAGKEPLLKIGETTQETVAQRVNQQDSTSNPEKLEIMYERELPDNIHDTTIHRFLEEKGCPKERKNREWFAITLTKAIRLINECITGHNRLYSYSMRPEQKDAHDKMVNYFGSCKDAHPKFLLAAKMRFGKNFTLLQVCKTLQCKNVLVLTYKPWVFDSLENDINNHVDFGDFNFIRYFEDRKLSTVKQNNTNIIVLSAQLGISEAAKHEDEDFASIEGNCSKNLYALAQKHIGTLNNLKYDMIIVDEYHYGASTIAFNDLLSQIDYSRLVYVSGTAMRDIKSHRFADDQVYNWTYVDEQNKKGNDMPKMKLFALSIDDELVSDIRENYETEEYPTMSKLFEVNDQGTFVHHNQVNRFVQQLMGENVSDQSASPFTINNIETPKHLFFIMPKSVKSIEAMYDFLVKESNKEYDIILASGNKGIKTQTELINSINRAKLENKGTITLSCMRFVEGVTVPDWDSVVMLDDGESVVSYFQAIFRCQSKFEDNNRRNECYVFDYSPQRMLKMTYLMTEVQSLISNKGHREVVKSFLECAPMVLRKSKNVLEPVDFKHLINAFFYKNKLVDRGCRSFEYERNFNDYVISDINTEIASKLPKVKKSGKTIDAEVLNDNGLDGGKNSKQGNATSDKKTSEKTSDISEIKKSLQFITGRLPEYMFNTKENEFCLNDILKTTSNESITFFRDLCKARLEDFQQLIKDGIYEERLVNQLISNYKTEEDDFWKNKSVEAYNELFFKYFTDDDDIKTPISLATEILDKLDSSVWSNKNTKLCDYACKDASFLIVAKYRFMVGLKSEIPKEQDREKHIVHNMLFAYCRTETQKNFVSRVLWNKEGECLCNIKYCENDILNKIESENMNFDVIVMNPPYKDTTHLKFLKKAIDMTSRYVLSVQPCNWLLKQVDTKSRGGKTEEDVITKVEEYGAEIHLIDGAQYFSAGLLAELSINFIDKKAKELGTPAIKVEGDLSGSSTTYTHVKDIAKYGDDEHILKFKTKLDSYFEDSNHRSIYNFLHATPRMLNHCSDNSLIESNPDESAFYVNFSAIRGHVNQTTGKKEDDFYTLVPKDITAVRYNKDLAMYVSFTKKTDAKNFIEYLKSDFVRFSLFLYKNDANVVHTLKHIPFFDFSQPQLDDSLMLSFDVDDDIQKRLRELIPDYYGIRKSNR